MLGVDQARVLVLHQLLHHGEHVGLPFVDEHFSVTLVRLLHLDVAEVHVIDAIAGPEPPAHLDGVAAHLARHTAVERDPVRRTVDDPDELLPAVDRSHDLLRATRPTRFFPGCRSWKPSWYWLRKPLPGRIAKTSSADIPRAR